MNKQKDKEILKEILETSLLQIDIENKEAWEIIFNLKRKLKINFSEE